MTIKADYVIRDSILIPHQIQIVDAKDAHVLATVSTVTDPGKYLIAALFVGFDKLGLRVKDETHVVADNDEPQA